MKCKDVFICITMTIIVITLVMITVQVYLSAYRTCIDLGGPCSGLNVAVEIGFIDPPFQRDFSAAVKIS